MLTSSNSWISSNFKILVYNLWEFYFEMCCCSNGAGNCCLPEGTILCTYNNNTRWNYTQKTKVLINRNFEFSGSTLCLNVDWCRIVNCIILTPLHIPILLLNCIHGPNEDGSAWLDVNCCCDNCCPSCLQPVDAPSYSDSPSEHSPLITSVCTHWS